MNLKPQRDEPSPFDQDPEAVRGTRCLARLLLVFLVVALLNVLLIGGRETLHVTGWLLLPVHGESSVPLGPPSSRTGEASPTRL